MSLDFVSLGKDGIVVEVNPSLSQYTTFQLGGPCPFLLDCQNPQQLELAVKSCLAQQQNFIVIGGGSNLLISQTGVSCVVIRYVSSMPLIERQNDELIVSGSTILDQLALYAAQEGFEGLSCTNGIPGTVGGAVAGNAGAFGKQIGDILVSASLLTRDGRVYEAGQSDLGFTYRHSRLKETGDIVLSVRLKLQQSDAKKLLSERDETLKIRSEKHPNLKTHPCAGSFFRNIEPTSKAERRQAAGWFLEQAGVKDFRVGGAVIFSKHANIIVKSNGCSPQDVYDLSLLMAKAVKEKFNLDLIREVRLGGDFKNKPAEVKDIVW